MSPFFPREKWEFAAAGLYLVSIPLMFKHCTWVEKCPWDGMDRVLYLLKGRDEQRWAVNTTRGGGIFSQVISNRHSRRQSCRRGCWWGKYLTYSPNWNLSKSYGSVVSPTGGICILNGYFSGLMSYNKGDMHAVTIPVTVATIHTWHGTWHPCERPFTILWWW